MAGLKEVREALILHQRLEARQISQLLALPQTRVNTLLSHLERMGLAERITPEANAACLPGHCRRCPTRQHCQSPLWGPASS